MPGQTSPQGRSGLLDDIESWMARRNADVQRFAAGAHAVGRQVWEDGNRLGRYISAERPSDVAALGVRTMQKAAGGGSGGAASGAGQAAARQRYVMPADAKRVATKAGGEILAGLNGAQDAFTFGLGDRGYAGVRALAEAAQGYDLARSYARHYAGTQALDAHDEVYHPIARTVGQIAGTGAQIAALGPAEGLLAGGARIAEATPLITREIAALGGSGAGVGVGGQAISDFANGHPSSLGDYAGAAVGGMAGALAARGGRAGYAGAAMGGATSLVQDALNGRTPSIDKARQAALTGGVLGTSGGLLGRGWSDSLARKEKELLGEDFSRLRTWIRGDQTLPGRKTAERLVDGGSTIPDQRTLGGQLVESKFGRFADLTKRQRQAFYQPLENYRVDHALPRDVGVFAGFLPSVYGSYALQPTDPGF
jgi:hypothetical protein